ncbi:MAG: hypothetical protein H0U36_04605 [Nocardioidaceae bacterium]|nr:hypothetical protein [Nocardioidaceae bacterium]
MRGTFPRHFDRRVLCVASAVLLPLPLTFTGTPDVGQGQAAASSAPGSPALMAERATSTTAPPYPTRPGTAETSDSDQTGP